MIYSYLQRLNVHKLLERRKLAVLIRNELEQYSIDFKARFDIDYSLFPVKPVGIREVS